MEVLVGVVTDRLNKLVDQAILQACYPFRFNNYAKELETEKEKLETKIQDVLGRSKDATKRTHKVVSEVEKWLDEANSLMAKVVELQEKTKMRNRTSCLKHCPNLIGRCSLAKELEGMTKEIKKRNEVGFSNFSRLATLVGMNYFSSQDFVHFESRKVAYDGLLRALGDHKIHMIGLYGMGGSGKTTLAKEVGKEAEKSFDQVVFVVVSNPIDVRKIQGKIAGQLNLELKEEENLERARRLSMRLTSGERFFIILDDVWDKLDFEAIGIPIANNQTSCTTLITTRKLNVCGLMNCQEIILVEGLNEDESLALFQKHAGLFDNSPNTFKDMALGITKECGGLPIAITAVASGLKDKHYDKWVKALKILGSPCWINVEERLKSTFICLKLSYDHLDDEFAKLLFLLCSVHPEDYEIQVNRLIVIGLGLGLAPEVPSYWLRTQVIKDAISKLLDSCLLLKAYEGNDNYVKMHDLVHDVAIEIAKKDNKLIMGPLKEDMIMKDNVVRYLWLEKVDKFPNKLNCPELEFLYVSVYLEPCVTKLDDFLHGMEKLTVLILENLSDQEGLALQLPSISISLISNLCCLVLSDWVLGDISFIGRLERLESLTIRDCSFDELPKCIIQQKKLRLLYLCGCKIQRSPFEVIGSCSQLEVLYFFNNRGTDWEDQIRNSAEFFDTISRIAPALESYCLIFGNTHEDFLFSKEFEDCNYFVARDLSIEDFENCISIGTSKDMMRRARSLSLRGIPRSLKNIIPDLWQTIGGGMNELTRLFIHDSDGIECVIGHANNPSQFGIISNLTHLTLTNVKLLKTLCSGHASQNLFANLEKLHIESCDSLEHILKEDVKEIVDGSEYESYGTAFPKLVRLKVRNCKKLESLMPISLAKNLAHVGTLYVQGCDELRSLFGQSLYEDLNLNKPRIIEFSALKDLELQDLQNIISICPENYHPTWPSMEWLQLHNCPKLNIKCIDHWVACGALRQEYDQMSYEDLLKAVVPPLETLQHLYLFNNKVEVAFDLEQLPISNQQVNSSLRDIVCTKLPQLKYIWRGPKNSLLLQHLSWLKLASCGYLKHIFPSSILKSLPQLWTLQIEDCNELEEVIEEDYQNVSNSIEPVFPRLAEIYIKRCHKLKCVFPKVSTYQVIPKLNVLSIEHASVLEQVFGHEQHDTTLEYVILWDLPSITSIAPSIALQTVKYIVVQLCPKLTLTSSITPQELLQLPKAYYYYLNTTLEDIIKSMDNYSGETTRQIDYQETGGPSNDQSLTFIASPNLTENEKGSEDQSADKQDTSEEKIVDGRAAECSASKSIKIVTPLTHSEPARSTTSANQMMHGLEMHTAIPTSSLRPESMNKQSTSNPVDLSLHKTPNDETSVRDLEGQNAHKENLSKGNDVNFEGPPSTHSKLASFPPCVLVTSSTNTVPHLQSQIKLNSGKSYVDDLKNDDLISVLESMEDDYGGESSILSVPTVPSADEELVAKAFAELEESLKMPLKDIATLEANSLRLRTSLNFLSRLSLEDGSLSNGIMSIVKSMHRDLPNIMSSFNQAFATVSKFAVLEERDKIIKDDLSQQKEVAIALVSKMAETQELMDEAQEKEARLQEHISKLEKQRKDCEAELLSLQEQKRKYMAEAIIFKEKNETVRKDKSEMVEEQRNAWQQLFQADHKWAVLCSQYEQHIANRNLT